MSSDSDNSLGDTIEEYDYEFPEVAVLESEQIQNCSCMAVESRQDMFKTMQYINETDFNISNVNCLMDNLIRIYNYAILNMTDSQQPERLWLTDSFYRTRHELLFKSLCKSFNLPVEKSDTPFSDFGIDSDRTPDLILKMADGSILIIEVSATSVYDKAAQSKGVAEAGFESKYASEINKLQDKGHVVVYVPVIFDMSEKTDNIEHQLKKLKKLLNTNLSAMATMRVLYHSLSVITSNVKELNYFPSAILFNNVMPVTQNHERLKFLYNTEVDDQPRFEYLENKVSHPVYKRISVLWDRIPNIIDQQELETEFKYKPVLSVNDGRLKFLQTLNGCTVNEMKSLIYNNNKPSFFKLLNIDTGNSLIPSDTSSTGYRVLSRVKVESETYNEEKIHSVIPTGLNHLPRPAEARDIFMEESLNNYRKLLDQYNSYIYTPLYRDINYEDKILASIKAMDEKTIVGKDYEKVDFSLNVNSNLLFNSSLKLQDIDKEMQSISTQMDTANSINNQLPLKKFRVKSAFIMPLAEINSLSYCDISNKNHHFINELIQNLSDSNLFTKELLRRCLNDNYKFYKPKSNPSQELISMIAKRTQLTMQISKIYRTQVKKVPKEQRLNYSVKTNSDFLVIRSQLSKLDKSIRVMKKDEGITEDISMIRLPSKNRKTEIGSWFNQEMSHFKRKDVQSTVEGVGLSGGINEAYESGSQVLQDLMSYLPVYAGENPDMVYIDTSIANDVPLLKQLKEQASKDYMGLINNVKNSYLGHSCALVSRLCHSLLFYSQLSYNADSVRIDNLGYNDVLLLVRGGNKIFKSHSSKLYRLVYPINKSAIKWVVGPGSSHQLFEYLGSSYIITPWQMMHESILTDGLSFYNRVVSFTVLNSQPNLLLQDQFSRISINILLAFHNRRQTEVFLANLRYILFSCLGDYSGMVEILKEFVGFNYDYFQSYLRSAFCINFPKYFNTLRSIMDSGSHRNLTVSDIIFSNKVFNIFTLSNISSQNDMAVMVYSTFLMTKAPYKRNVERASNLQGILNIHTEYNNKIGLGSDSVEQFKTISVSLEEGDTIETYCKKLFSNDFNIDPYYISNLGSFADSLLKRKTNVDQINVEWIKIMSESWDAMATSTGLRGDLNDVTDFWGKKGYFVVYKDLIKNYNFLIEIRSLFKELCNDDAKRKSIRKLNQTYLDKVKEPSEFWIFHAVDKTQWRGGREIYVMDIHTKQSQQPIEKFMGHLCKLLDNELISIPSDKRSQVIHHSIFEKDISLEGYLTWYLTLDCSKWAPKSSFVKFAVMVLNMQTIPPSFKTHFMNYLDKLYVKRIYFNDSEVQVLNKNPVYTELISKHLIKDEIVGGYYMVMPYSWVMGIFNYTSSFMHAVNQEYASYLITKSCMENLQEETTMVMYAHSDDSGGRLTAQYECLIKRGLFLYELQLKCCNHLLSKKKSVVSRFYFEILSIIYIFKQLLALLPKFLGGLRFLPTDKGPAQDMSQAYSKCIEVMIAGADFSTAYLIMNFYSALVWRFYYNRKPIETDFRRPVQFLGIPCAHPLMVLLAGSDSDIVRILHSGGETEFKKILRLNNLLKSNMLQDSLLPGYKFKIKVRGIQKGFEEPLDMFKEELNDWSIRYVNFKNTAFNFLNFLSKLNDPGFVGSLVNESTVRRISRSFYLRVSDSISTAYGDMSLSQLVSAIEIIQSYSSDEPLGLDILLKDDYEGFLKDYYSVEEISESQCKAIKVVLSGPLQICNYMSTLEFKPENVVPSNRTLKPTHLQLSKTGVGFSSPFDPAVLVSYITQPEYRWALPDVRNLEFLVDELTKLCYRFDLDINNLEPSFLLQLSRFFSVKNVKDIYLYSRLPSSLRQIRNYTGFLSFLAANSFVGKEIKGMVLKLDNDIIGADYLTNQIEDVVYNTATIISLLTVLTRVTKKDIKELPIHPVKEIEWEGGTLLDLCDSINTRSVLNDGYTLLKLQNEYLREICIYNHCKAEVLEGSYFYTFLRSQKTGSAWHGRGEILINCGSKYFSFEVNNDVILSCETNLYGKIDYLDLNYLLDVMQKNGIKLDHRYLLKPNQVNTEDMFGFDWSGDISVHKKAEMKNGVPATVRGGKLSFMNNLSAYNIQFLDKNKYMIINKFEESARSYKVYTLTTSRRLLMPMIKQMFDPADFEEYLMQEGFGSLNEFIYNEVLGDYGTESYIGLVQLVDNFSASRLYEILKASKEKSLAQIPKKISTTMYPAPQGGLLRLFYEYSREEATKPIIKIPKDVNPEYLAVRSLFPEQFTAVLSETLQNNYFKLYSLVERREIAAIYKDLSTYEDMDSLRVKLIKTMSYWGYTSLTNVVQLYNFTQDEANYSALKYEGNFSYSNYHSELFVSVYKSLQEAMLENEHLLSVVELPVDYVKFKDPLLEFLDRLNMGFALGPYRYKHAAQANSLYYIQFLNLLSGLLTENSFVESLENKLKREVFLSTLPVDHKYRYKLFAMLNNLKHSWMLKNKVDFTLVFDKRNQRLPDNIVDPVSLYKTLCIGKANVTKKKYFHGQLSSSVYNFLMKDRRINAGGKTYLVKTELGRPGSDIPLAEGVKFKRNLNLEELDGDMDFEDLIYELEMSLLDLDTINEYMENLADKMYMKSTTFVDSGRDGVKVYCRINVFIIFGMVGSSEWLKSVRQMGENIVIVTDLWLPILYQYFDNVHVRKIRTTGIEGSDLDTEILCYCLFSKKVLDQDFVDGLYGRDRVFVNRDVESVIGSNNYINYDETIGLLNLNFEHELKLLKTPEQITVEEAQKKERKAAEDEEKKKVKNVLRDNTAGSLSEILTSAVENGKINITTKNHLYQKYRKAISHDSKRKLEAIMQDLFTEINLNKLQETAPLLLKGNLTPQENLHITQMPKHWGLAFENNRIPKNMFKDKKVQIELNSLSQDLPNLIGSATLTISHKFAKMFYSNYNLWRSATKITKHKKGNKEFLLTLLNLIVNDSYLVINNHDGSPSKHDSIWREIIDNSSSYFGDEGEEIDIEELQGFFGTGISSRMIYTPTDTLY